MNDDLLIFLQAWTGGAEVPEPERVRLLARFREDADFRQECLAEMSMLGLIHAAQTPTPPWPALQKTLQALASAPADVPAEKPRWTGWTSLRRLAATAACAALLVGGGLWWQTSQRVIATVVNDAASN